jgi:hypothetical protein
MANAFHRLRLFGAGCAVGSAWCNHQPGQNLVAQPVEPIERGLFNYGFIDH